MANINPELNYFLEKALLNEISVDVDVDIEKTPREGVFAVMFDHSDLKILRNQWQKNIDTISKKEINPARQKTIRYNEKLIKLFNTLENKLNNSSLLLKIDDSNNVNALEFQAAFEEKFLDAEDILFNYVGVTLRNDMIEITKKVELKIVDIKFSGDKIASLSFKRIE